MAISGERVRRLAHVPESRAGGDARTWWRSEVGHGNITVEQGIRILEALYASKEVPLLVLVLQLSGLALTTAAHVVRIVRSQ
jgi:hypothetical protein